MSGLKKYAVIVAGGSGSRMGTEVPKQFLLLHGKTVLWHTLKVFLDAYEDMEIVLVLPEDHLETGRTILAAAEASVSVRDGVNFQHRLRAIRLVAGGATRFHSVRNGLRSIKEELARGGPRLIEEDSVVFVHDGVRCLLTKALVHRCYEQAVRLGSAIPVIACRDSVRLVSAAGHEAVDRGRVKLVQTPQTFVSSVLLPAYEVEYREAFTDEATVVEAAGHAVHLIEGEADNIKITMPGDLVVAEAVMPPAGSHFL
jgi:2-C-methyl-D-erythritol 4-phosphate cytidylyltransferase